MFGRGNIKNNGIVATYNQDMYRSMVSRTIILNQLIYDGLLFALKREVPDWQDWMDNCDDYPFLLRFGELEKMEALFKVMHERIVDEIFSREHPVECDCKPTDSVCPHMEIDPNTETEELYL